MKCYKYNFLLSVILIFLDKLNLLIIESHSSSLNKEDEYIDNSRTVLDALDDNDEFELGDNVKLEDYIYLSNPSNFNNKANKQKGSRSNSNRDSLESTETKDNIENESTLRESKYQEYEEEFSDELIENLDSTNNLENQLYSYFDNIHLDSFHLDDSIVKALYDHSLSKEENDIEIKKYIFALHTKVEMEIKILKQFRSVYANQLKVYLSMNDLLALLKSKTIEQKDLITIYEYLLNTKTERKYLSNLIKNENNSKTTLKATNTIDKVKEKNKRIYEKKVRQKTRQKQKQHNSKDTNSLFSELSNSSPQLALLFSILNKFTDILFKHLIFFFSCFFIIILTKLINQIKINAIIYTITSLFLIIKSFSYYENNNYLASSLLLFQFCYFVNSTIKNFCLLVDVKDYNLSLFNNNWSIKSKSQFIVKCFLALVFILLILYISTFFLRYFFNYLLVFYLISKVKEHIDDYLTLKLPYCYQPFPDFSSVLIGVFLILYSQIFLFLNDEYAYELYSLLIFFNTFGFYYFTSLNNYFNVLRNNHGRMYVELEKQKISNSQLSMSDLNESVKVMNFWDYLNGKTSMKLRGSSFNTTNKQFSMMDFTIVFFYLFFLILGFATNTYFYYCISLFLFKIFSSYSLMQMNTKYARITGNLLYVIFVFAISVFSKLENRFMMEFIYIQDKRIVNAMKQLLQLVFLVLLFFAYFINRNFLDYINFHNYDSYKYVKDEIYSKLACEKDSSTIEAYAKKIDGLFSLKHSLREFFFYDKELVINQVNKVFDVLRLPTKGLESIYIEHLLKRSESYKMSLLLVLDLFSIYICLLVLNISFKKSNNYFLYVVGLFHKSLIMLMLVFTQFEYSKTKLQKYILAIFNLALISRLLQISESSEIINLAVISISLYFQVLSPLFIYKFDIYHFTLICFYSIIYSHHVNDYLLCCVVASALAYLFVEKTFKFKLSLTQHFIVKLIILILCVYNSNDEIVRYVFQRAVSFVYYIEDFTNLNIFTTIETYVFNRQTILSYPRRKNYNYLYYFGWVFGYDIDKNLPYDASKYVINENLSYEELVIVSLGEYVKDLFNYYN